MQSKLLSEFKNMPHRHNFRIYSVFAVQIHAKKSRQPKSATNQKNYFPFKSNSTKRFRKASS